MLFKGTYKMTIMTGRIMELICAIFVLAFLAFVHYGAGEVIHYRECESAASIHNFMPAYHLTCRDANQYNFDSDQFRKAMEINFDFLTNAKIMHREELSPGDYESFFRRLVDERNNKIRSLINNQN